MSAVSEQAKENGRKKCRDAYYWYKSHGICPKCKTEWSAPGKVYCEKCLRDRLSTVMRYGREYNNQKCKEFRERMKAQGLCQWCGNKAVEGRVLCAACAKKNSEAQQVRKMRRRLAKEAEKERENAKLSMV